MSQNSTDVLLDADGAIRIVTLNRPQALNAADEGLHRAVAEVWDTIAADKDARAVVITGAGRAFSGGGDLNLLDRMTGDLDLRARIMDEALDIVRGMTNLQIPIVAAVNGPAVGLGCSLAGMSDLVVIEEQAYFSDPHVMLGLVAADGGALTWPLLTSLMRAKEYLLLGERLSAAQAVEFGLANRVVPEGSSLEVALDLAGRLAALPPQAVRETKSLLNTTLRSVVAQQLEVAVEAETRSFDEQAFRTNLSRMLERSERS